MSYGYDFYFDTPFGLVTFPITPAELKIKVGSNNEVVTLINQGDINILKSPELIEVEFEARFPMRKYPYSRDPEDFKTYFDVFTKVKEQKKPFRFIIARKTPKGSRTWDTNIQVALEDFQLSENADEGDDVLVDFSLKQYKDYGVKTIKVPSSSPSTTSTSSKSRSSDKGISSQTYTVKKGDCLWNISKKFYGNGAEWKKIYNANKSVIEETAKKYGKKSSSNGWWLYSGEVLTIPAK